MDKVKNYEKCISRNYDFAGVPALFIDGMDSCSAYYGSGGNSLLNIFSSEAKSH